MKNITITLDDQTAEWARRTAADQSKSLSRYVGDLLQQHLSQAREYDRAMQAWFAQGPVFSSIPGEVLPKREEIYAERTGIR
jgi:hypothetical protein